MSLYNGDKSRDNRRRRARSKQRGKNRELKKSLELGAAEKPKANESQPASRKS